MEREVIIIMEKCKSTGASVPETLMDIAWVACKRIRKRTQNSKLFELENIKVEWEVKDYVGSPHTCSWEARFTININSELTASKKTLRVLMDWSTSKDNHSNDFKSQIDGEPHLNYRHSSNFPRMNNFGVVVPKQISAEYIKLLEVYMTKISHKLCDEINKKQITNNR